MISRKNILEISNRKKIYEYILKNPSSYEREISKKIGIPKSTLRYHLYTLKKRELINSREEKGYTRYFVLNKLGKREKEILSVLKQEVPRNILLYLMYYVVCSQKEISKVVEKRPSTIAYHLKKLKKICLITIVDNKPDEEKKKPSLRKKFKGARLYKIIDRETYYNLYDL